MWTKTAVCLIVCLSVSSAVWMVGNPYPKRVHGFRFDEPLPETDSHVDQLGFAWTNCGGPNSSLHVNHLHVGPNPIKLPGTLNVTGNITVKYELDKPLKLNLYVAKKILGTYIKVPCVSNVGSCTYDDLCSMLNDDIYNNIGQQLGVDLKCPFKNETYIIPPTKVDVNLSGLPGGDYHINAKVSHAGKQAFCLDVYLTVK